MARILWHSNAPWSASGYGQQTAVFTPRIRDMGHHVAISAYWGLMGSILNWGGMTVYPGDTNTGNYGDRLLPIYAKRENPDLAITLMDVWVLNAKKLKDLPLACWVPVDQTPAPPKVIEFFEESGARPIAMSRFGERMLRDAGLDPLYVPHGIDTDTFAPRHDRAEARARMGVSDDVFVVGMVAANKGRGPSRKSFPEVMQAFAMLLREDPGAILYLHTEMTGREAGVPMGRLLKQCGIPTENVRWTDQLSYELGVTPDGVSQMMGAFDVLANPAYGEGFGIPIVEAQACGTPVIVTDGTAMRELCGAGWLAEADPWYNVGQGTFFDRPRPESIYRAMVKARAARGDHRLRDKARAFALAYDADVVADTYWRPALDTLLGRSNTALQAVA